MSISKLFELAQTNPASSRVLALARRHPRLSRLIDHALAHSREIERFVKFALVGTSGTVVDFGLLNLLIQVFGFSLVAANTCSFSAAVLNNFIWNRLWTFPESRERPVLPQLVQFTLVNVAGWAINTGILWTLSTYVFTMPLWGYNLSKAIAIVVVLFWNFGINRMWTYKGI
jgi:putative flippase GtrA